MTPVSWARRRAAAVRDLAVRAAAGDRGVALTINGLARRVDASSRRLISADYERPIAALLDSCVERGSTVWNVGANVGVYALQLGPWVGVDGRVLAFEPNPAAARALRKNVRLNGLADRVEIVEAAVGETSGSAILYASGSDGMSRLGRPNPLLETTTVVRVRVVTLDEVVAWRGAAPSWIVMDIEGWEIAALRSARRVLGHSRFIIELHPSAWSWSGHSRADLESLLMPLGLEVVPLTGQADPLGEHGHVLINAGRRA